MAVQLGRILILSCFVGLAVSDCGQNSFKSDAGEKITAAFKSSHRKGVDYSKIEVEWQPFWMVEDPECINKGMLFLQMNHDGGDEWNNVDGKMKSSGSQGKFKWTVDVAPCKDHYFRVWVDGDGGQASFVLPSPVEAVSEEQLKESNYEVLAPEDVKAQVLSGNEVKISFTPSECALEYEILYNKAGSNDEQIPKKITKDDGNSFILTDQVEACTDYDYYIYASIGDKITSEEASGFFTTAPNQDSASRLVPEITQATDSLTVSWNTAECPCVAKYEVSICKADQEDCGPVEVSVGNIPTITHNAESLDECTPYAVTIKPIYQDFELDVKTIDSRTLSPNVADVIDQLVVVSGAKLAEEGGQGIEVFWSPVQCATSYKVYQMQEKENSDWEEVATSEGTNWKGAGVPCTEYRYGVSVLIGDSKSEIRDIGEPITTALDDDAVYEAPNLDIIPASDQVVLTFDHGSCISEYEIRICQEELGEEFCNADTYTPTQGEHNISFTGASLEPCTKYKVQINPMHEGVRIVSANRAFVTASPEPTPPEDSNVTLSNDHQFVELNWSKVRCATGYKILQQVGESDTETAWDTDDVNLLSNRIQNPVPCTNYKYGIAAIVGGVDSPPTEWQDITVPPREGEDNKPTMGALSKENDTLSFELKPDGDNSKCKVENYEIKYFDGKDTQEVTFSVGDVENNIILLESVPGDAQIYARVKYAGFETPSDWTNNIPPPESTAKNSGDLLVPIVIGVLVAVIVIVVIIFFIVKRRKTSQKYDAEKANGTTDETEKLNDSEKLAENPKA